MIFDEIAGVQVQPHSSLGTSATPPSCVRGLFLSSTLMVSKS